jgi:hypothetical protein
MSQPLITPLNYTYKKSETDVWVLNLDDLPIEKSLVKDQQIVHLGPGAIGGNHQHPRREWFVGIGELLFVWLDEHGDKHEEEMHPSRQLKLIAVPPHLPHAVVNTSTGNVGILFELADGKMVDVEPVLVTK